MSDLMKKENTDVTQVELNVDIKNGGVPSDYYASNPCLIGYSYIRFEVSGGIVPCCIAKHFIGHAYEQDWRDVWHSGAYENFRKKMARIHLDKFHRTDPEWSFCQQCSHLLQNKEKNELLNKT